MKEKVVVAAIQIDLHSLSVEKNTEIIKRKISEAAQNGAELIVFPELSNAGYITVRDKHFGRKFYEASDYIPGNFTEEIARQAQECDVYVIVGMSEKHPVIPGTLYNSAVLISPDGEVVGTHRKVHTPGEEKHYFAPGNSIKSFQTALGTIGISICYDTQFPELTRTLALEGTEILCLLWNMPSFSNKPRLLEHYTAARSAENRMYTISANRIGSDDGHAVFFGHSCISDPVGTIVALAKDDEEDVIYATLERKTLLEERAQMTVFGDRHAHLYSKLTEID